MDGASDEAVGRLDDPLEGVFGGLGRYRYDLHRVQPTIAERIVALHLNGRRHDVIANSLVALWVSVGARPGPVVHVSHRALSENVVGRV